MKMIKRRAHIRLHVLWKIFRRLRLFLTELHIIKEERYLNYLLLIGAKINLFYRRL